MSEPWAIDEKAKILLRTSSQRVIPFVTIRMQFNDTEGLDKTLHLTGLEGEIKLSFPQNIPAYLENLRALGLIERPAGALSDIEKHYKNIEERYGHLAQKVFMDGHPDGKRYPIVFLRGYFQMTAFGDLFIRACLKGADGRDLLAAE